MIFSFIGTAHAAGDAQAAGGSAFPPFDATSFPGQIFWLVLTFGVLYFLMSKIALPRVSEIIETRQSKIDGDLKSAAIMQEKARLAGEAYEKLLADAKANAQSIGQKAKDSANSTADAQRKTIEADTANKIAVSEAQIVATRDKAMTNVAGIATSTAAEIVKRITGVAPKADELKSAVATTQS
jgi:F-type H+-transporting ATPase subunit b